MILEAEVEYLFIPHKLIRMTTRVEAVTKKSSWLKFSSVYHII